MRHFFLLSLWFSVSTGILAHAQNESADLLLAEIEELRSVVRNLDDANRKLVKENDELTEEVVMLRRALSQKEAEASVAAAGSPNASPPHMGTAIPPPALAPQVANGIGEVGLDVIYVNPTWHYLILSGGTDKGMNTGQTGRILRGGNVVARVKVSSVKPSQSVADIDVDSLAQRGQYPRVGDAVVFP